MDAPAIPLPSVSIVVTILFASIICYLLWFYKRLANYPPGPIPLPVIGNILSFRGYKRHWNLEIIELSKKYGPVITIWLGPYPIIIICDMELGKETFNKYEFSGRPWTYMHDAMESNILLKSGPTWEHARKITQMSLREFIKSSQLNAIVDDVVHQSIDAINKCRGVGSSFKGAEYAYDMLRQVISCMLFGERFNKEDSVKLKYISSDYQNDMGDSGFIYQFVPASRPFLPYPLYKYRRCYADIYKLTLDKVNARMKAIDGENVNDFCDMLINARLVTNGRPVIDTVPNNIWVTTMLIETYLAATDTNHSTMKWLLLLYTYYTDVRKRLCYEISEQLCGRMPVESDMESMPYTVAFISETLRFRNPTPIGLYHLALEHGRIGKYNVSKGTRVIFHQQCALFDEHHWPNPHEFIPDRFIASNGKYKVPNSGAFCAFSIGRRKCPGDKFSLINLFLLLVRFIQLTDEYDIVLDKSDCVADDDMLAPDPSSPWMQFPKPYKLAFKAKNGNHL